MSDSRDFWGAEKVMAAALRTAAKRAELPKERMEDWNLSVTHKVRWASRGSRSGDRELPFGSPVGWCR